MYNSLSHSILFYPQFGFKKWKSHVTSRPLSERSDIVKDLYADLAAAKPVRGEVVPQTGINYDICCLNSEPV